MGVGDKISDAVDDMVDGVVDAIETAITKMLAGGASSMIQESLSLFKSGLNISEGSTIGSGLTTMPNDYNLSVWGIVHKICTNIVAPFGGMILVIIYAIMRSQTRSLISRANVSNVLQTKITARSFRSIISRRKLSAHR